MPHERPKREIVKELQKARRPQPEFRHDPRRNAAVLGIEALIKIAIDTPKGQKPPLKILVIAIDLFEEEYKGRLTDPQQKLIIFLRKQIEEQDLDALSKLLHQNTCFLKLAPIGVKK
ncbi:MAG: hypothetical protein ABIH20_04715 [Candidatus Diapherotrites archaeon]